MTGFDYFLHSMVNILVNIFIMQLHTEKAWKISQRGLNRMKNNWQSIHTAPKDRRILLAYKDGEVETGRYYDEINGFICGSMLQSTYQTLKLYQPIAWQELPVFDGVIAE